MLHLYTSNRLENLLGQLAGVLGEPLRSPLESETVVVQSLGMRRWLSLELAERLGVCANVGFPFPQTFIHKIFTAAVPDEKPGAELDRTNMTWRIMKLLPPLLSASEFADLRQYLSGDRAELKRFQLAGKIAEVFDQYLIYRPEMI